jgi:hypothetical protein
MADFGLAVHKQTEMGLEKLLSRRTKLQVNSKVSNEYITPPYRSSVIWIIRLKGNLVKSREAGKLVHVIMINPKRRYQYRCPQLPSSKITLCTCMLLNKSYPSTALLSGMILSVMKLVVISTSLTQGPGYRDWPTQAGVDFSSAQSMLPEIHLQCQ